MCGICGFIGEGEPRDIQSMADSMVHRGPDAGGLWTEPRHRIFLGHRRLSIIDLESGAQPMATADGRLVIVFNGEIYNHRELRRELEAAGHRFVTDHSDTEVLLHGYRQWGGKLPEKLNGMWALALADLDARTLFVSRDRFGKKPLFYTLQNGTFAFASELSALTRHRAVKANISTLSLKKYFAYGYIPAPHSMYEGVRKLPGGHSLWFQWESRNLKVEQYWNFVIEPFETVPRNPEQEWGEQIRSLLFKAVKRRMIADVPLGVFLSGGIDSSSIISLAITASGARPIQTFSIGFEESSFDESPYSSAVASILGSDHHLQILSVQRSRDLLPQIAEKLDEPMGDSSILPTYLLCREARKRVTVAVGGDGADELFCGYDPFRALRLADLYSRLVPRPVHAAIRMAAALLPTSHRNMSLDFRVKRTLRGLSYPRSLWTPIWMASVDPGDFQTLFHEPADLEEIYSEAIAAWEGCRQPDLIDKTLQFYTKLYLQDDILVKVDRASMMNSLEVRAPYLDIDLVNFVRRIPSRYKYRNGQTKYILKEALKSILPLEILYRSKKGFGVPIGQWFMDGSLNAQAPQGMPCLSKDFIDSRIQAHRAGRSDERAFLWNVWLLSQWKPSR